MFLALREIRRGIVRFSLLAMAIGLLLFLVLFQQALQNSLITSFVGAVRNQTAPVIVYGIDAQRALQGSVLTADLEADVIAVEGVGAHARLGETTVSLALGDDEIETSIIGTDDPLGLPRDVAEGRTPSVPGEALGSSADFAVGEEVIVLAGGDRLPLRVVGIADDVQLSVSPTLFVDFDTYEEVVRAVNPDAPSVPTSALVLAPADGVTAAELVDRINAQVGDADAATREEAADTAPGVAPVRQSFRVILALYALVVPLVTGLFFLIVTLQKRRSLVLLRAIGARSGVLTRALVLQVLMITGVGIAIGAALTLPLAGRRLGGLTLRFEPGTLLLWSVGFLVLAVLGAIASLQRVRRVDPVSATVGVMT
jgi:putative ABC transport system permease protein